MILSYFILRNRLCHVSTIQWGKERIKGKNRGIDDLRWNRTSCVVESLAQTHSCFLLKLFLENIHKR